MKNKILDDIKRIYLEKPDVLKSMYLFCLFTAVFLFSPLLNVVLDLKPSLHDFSNHIMSNAALNDFEMASRIKYYFLTFVVTILFSVALFVFAFKFFMPRFIENDKNHKAFQTLFNLSLIGIAGVISSFFVVNVDVALFFIFGLGVFMLLSTVRTNYYWEVENAFWILTMSLPFSLVMFKIIQKNIPPEKYQSLLMIGENSFPIITLGLKFILTLTFVSLGVLLFIKFFFKGTSQDVYALKRNQLQYATIPISCILIAQSLLLEFFNVLNLKYNYVFNSPRLLFVIVTLLALIISIFLYYKKSQKQDKIYKNNALSNYHFPLLILGIAFIIVQPWRIFQPDSEFFEFANHGIAVDHFFRYGSIPIIENYDAHMLSTQLFAYVYGIISGYEPWAPFLYNQFAIVIYPVLLYFVFKKILGSKITLLLLLCLPIISTIDNSFTMLCLVGLALYNVIKKDSTKSFYLLWLSILFTCIFRLDLGFASLIGGIIGYISVNYLLRKKGSWKKATISAVVSFGGAFVLFMGLCVIKGLNPLKRLHEFLLISSSNQNWANKDLGETADVAFRICYYLLPLLLVVVLVNVILKSIISKKYVDQILQNKVHQAAFVFFIYFSTAYFFNIPRGIVRHSYAENTLSIVIGCLPIALLCCIYLQKRKNNLALFLGTFIGMYLLMGLNIKSYKSKETSLFSQGLYSNSFQEKFTDSYSFNGTRVKVPFSLAEVNQFRKVLDLVLQPNETYFDFSSTNYYYALVARKNPVYVNQSPLLLNGDVSQQMALEQIKDSDVSLVLMPNKNTIWKTIDMVDSTFKYYLVSEYVYQNFTPLMSLNSFDIYVRKDKKTHYEAILKAKLGSSNSFQLNDFANIDVNIVQNHNTITTLNNDKSLSIKANGDDPFVIGLLNQIKEFDAIDKNIPVKINFDITVAAVGSIQVFYQLGANDGFKEENSKRFTFDKVGDANLELLLPSYPKEVRIDLELPDVVIKHIQIVGSNGMSVEKPQIKSINLQEIPRIWSEYSDNEIFETVPNLEEVLNQSSVSMPLKKGAKPCYLYVEMDAADKQIFGVELFDAQNQQKAVYYFTSKAGKHRYAIRLSADYYWWNEPATKISLSTSTAIAISKLAVVSADGKEVQPYTMGGFTLSNITDANWNGGIGIADQSNLLLFDNSKRHAGELNKGNYIELSDGSKIKIDKKEVNGNFIRVTISQNIEALYLKLQYPNELKIVK